ncbi:hypothetical protein [Flagellimonas pacifica]|uniref:Uncharacterized protein n=1 Tax=Flagellimonas pacifica TaxID=1247520 RepID=A0A285MWW6_9FLAO|nr:hypothetical protein [Allomuricauda parva]SNZ01675.1 hypothetical protein SAMN06265377_3517 [Allomuricauda parva]
MNHQPYGVHIALTKYPLGQETEYIENIRSLYTSYGKKIEEYLNSKEHGLDNASYLKHLYSPKVFHLFSHFDAAFVSVIDNYKFTQRVFEPRCRTKDGEPEPIKNVSYQIISGSLLGKKKVPTIDKFLDKPNRFVKIVQLKITNGLVIGNGNKIFESSVVTVETVLETYGISDYILIDSFNWSELVLIASHEDPNVLTNSLLCIRKLKLKELEGFSEIVENSLYGKWSLENIQEAHVFNDTHSYLGVDFTTFSENSFKKDIKFESTVEWQVKPGHFPQFCNETSKQLHSGEIHSRYGKARFKYGKTDFVVEEIKPNNLSSNQEIFTMIRNNSNLRNHIRKIKTKPVFKFQSDLIKQYNKERKQEFLGPCQTEDYLEKYKVDVEKKAAIYLRKLNVSRNVRKKVRKVIYNYNQGIQDPILYIYYIDLYHLLESFVEMLKSKSAVITQGIEEGSIKKTAFIEENSAQEWHEVLKTKFIEDIINDHVEVFEEALQSRLLNNYNFEDLNEFSLDINSANTSILSSMDAIIKHCARCFRDSYASGLVTRINDTETVSNSISVNYNIDHLICPPLVFATLIKEILNNEMSQFFKQNESLFDTLNKKWLKISENDFGALERMIIEKQHFGYFEVDVKKYLVTYFENQDLYVFWHWTYLLQNTSMQSALGCLDEYNFLREHFRLLLIAYGMKFDGDNHPSKMTCPIPELKTFWDRHHKRLCSIVERFVKEDEFETWLSNLKDQVMTNLYFIDSKKDETSMIPHLKEVKYQSLKTWVFEFIWNGKNEVMPNLTVKEFHKRFMDILYEDKHPERDTNFNKIKSISVISYYCLHYVYYKFSGKPRMLRRDYTTGEPIKHFLHSDTWFIDSFGGFFVNCPEERKDFNHFCNVVLNMIWSYGVYLKSDQL